MLFDKLNKLNSKVPGKAKDCSMGLGEIFLKDIALKG